MNGDFHYKDLRIGFWNPDFNSGILLTTLPAELLFLFYENNDFSLSVKQTYREQGTDDIKELSDMKAQSVVLALIPWISTL